MIFPRPMSFDLKVLATVMLILLSVGGMILAAQAIWIVAIRPDFYPWAVLICFACVGAICASCEIIGFLWTPRPSADSE